MPVYEALEIRAPLTLEEYKAQLVSIPAGSFLMGGERYDHEKPLHRVTLSGFQMGRTPVTVGMWQEFCKAQKGREMPELPSYPVWERGWDSVLDHPIVNVSWDDCTAYADWAGLTLPSFAQREFAARGGLEGKLYPWGDEEPKNQLWWRETSNGCGTAPVQRANNVFVNGYGLVDMLGNVWEWCEDWHEKDKYRVLCGGSWGSSNAGYFRCAYRSWFQPAGRITNNGFRLSSRPLK